MEHRILSRSLMTFCLVMILGMTACYYDNEEELYPSGQCVTDNMSYVANILPIMERNCYTCHSNANIGVSGISLEGHANLLVYVNNGKLMGSINHLPGFSAMPQDAAKLSACDISKIEQWIVDGAPNN